jgi:hypothetical protein
MGRLAISIRRQSLWPCFQNRLVGSHRQDWPARVQTLKFFTSYATNLLFSSFCRQVISGYFRNPSRKLCTCCPWKDCLRNLTTHNESCVYCATDTYIRILVKPCYFLNMLQCSWNLSSYFTILSLFIQYYPIYSTNDLSFTKLFHITSQWIVILSVCVSTTPLSCIKDPR